MGKRITSLQEITTVTENDYIPVDNQTSGVRKLSADFINDLEDTIDSKQDALTAGANISIAQDGTISATDTTYTAGTNVDITNGVISATDTTYTAGTNVDITNGVISATDTTYTAGTNITITNGEISATDTDTLSGLTDTTISSPSDGDALVYDSTSGKWVNGGVASDIGDLNDVDITTPSNGQVLAYDSTSQEWVNTTPSAGSSVSVTQIQSSGTKIATVTVDNVDTDLYAPTGGGGGGSTSSYGYTTPLSGSGSDGDIYNKIEDINGTDETVTTPVSISHEAHTFQFPKNITDYNTITISGTYNGVEFPTQTTEIQYIGEGQRNQTYVINSTYANFVWYRTNDSIVVWATTAEITSCYGTYTNSHKIVDIYQKTSDSWSKYEDKGSIVVANPSGTAATDLEKISIDGTIYDIPSGGGGGSGFDEDVLYEASNVDWVDITVDWDWDDYDFYIFRVHDAITSSQGGDSSVLTKQQISDLIANSAQQPFYRDGSYYATYIFSANQITRSSHNLFAIIEIVGCKISGGGSSGGSNLYGTTTPTSSEGENGDIYMKYDHRYVNTSFISSSTSIPWGSTLDVTITDMDTYDSLHIEGTCMKGGYGGQPFDEDWDVDDIPSSGSSAVQVTANSDCYMYRDGDTLKFYNTVNAGTITLLEGAKADVPYIVGEYGKIEDTWCEFPHYSETVLWSGSQSVTRYDTPFTIPDIGMSELNEYDAFAFDFYSTYNVPRFGIMLTSHIKAHQDADVTLESNPADSACSLFMHYDSVNDILKAAATTNYGYTLTKIIGIKYGDTNKIEMFHNYSTTEHVVGTWIDGKLLYERTFTGTLTNEGSEQLLTGIDYAMTEVNSCNGMSPNGISSYNIANTVAINTVLDNHVLTLYSQARTTSVDYVVTIRYTKVTS